MKYHYYYQTKNNVSRDDWIHAKDRNAAYAALRQKGIKPYRLEGRNPVAWKRWATIFVLLVIVFALGARLYTHEGSSVREDLNEQNDSLLTRVTELDLMPRHQIYGNPAIIAEGVKSDWSKCGFTLGERILAKFAQPGQSAVIEVDASTAASALEECLSQSIEVLDGDLLEHKQIKTIVGSMKAEAREYLSGGGTASGYIDELIARQQREIVYYRAAEQDLSEAVEALDEDAFYNFWVNKNAELRAIGLPAIAYPDAADKKFEKSEKSPLST